MLNQPQIIHKFNRYDFGFGFETTNGILNITPYEPKVLVIGTFNHGWPWNKSDFFYGRDMYMWPALHNIFILGVVVDGVAILVFGGTLLVFRGTLFGF
jgi:hypothetical protein